MAKRVKRGVVVKLGISSTTGERLEECAVGARRWDWCDTREEWEAKAARLGIKPEGE